MAALRGRLYLQVLECAYEVGLFNERAFEKPHEDPRLSYWDKGWRIANRLAKHWQISRS